MSTYKISSLCPVQFHKVGAGDFAYNKIPSFEYLRGYNQLFFHGDTMYVQILSTSSSAAMSMALVDNNGVVFKSWTVFKSTEMYFTYSVFHWVNTLPYAATAPEGIYFLRLNIADDDGSATFYSEPIKLMTTKAETVKIVYTHDENDFDRMFTGSVWPSMIRIEGGMKSDGLQPGGKFTLFQDQANQSVMLNSNPFNVEKWTFGPSEGIPNHLADKLNRIFGLSSITIDGVFYSRNEGAKMERQGETDYPLAGWSIDLIKTENPFSEEYGTVVNPLTADSTAYTADSSLLTADMTQL